jgi:glycosyltransferase involved in cell wall biosynthesis
VIKCGPLLGLLGGNTLSKPESINADLEQQYEDLLNQLPSRAPIYLPTEKIPLEDKIRGVAHVNRIYKQDLDEIYRPKLRALRKKFQGSKRCFLIGNGPSLNRTDLDMLKNEVTFAVNGFFLKAENLDWKPTFYVVEDHLVAEDRAKWINEFKGPIKLFPAYLGYMFEKSDDTIFYNHRPRKSYPHGYDFSLEADKITYTGCTVTFSMMQLAAYFGFEEIYLIGVDASYQIPDDAKEGKDYGVGVLDMKSDDPNHFDPNYFGKGFRWHDPQVEKMVEAYGEARRTLEGTGQTIYNATVGGMLEVFERRDFSTLFPLARSPEQVEADNRAATFPRMLILDMTAMGNGTATGEIKSNLTKDWPKDKILQLARHGRDGLALVRPDGQGGYAQEVVSKDEAFAAIQAFNPDLSVYRPVPNVAWLHEASMDILRRLDKPLVTWIMDDWPAELAEKDPEQWASLGPDLNTLLEKSTKCLSICDSMSKGMGERYGVEFTALANGVYPEEWNKPREHARKQLRVRYAGGLAKNMTRDSVLRIARAVESLAEEGHPISFEINTQKWWYRETEEMFSGFNYTQLTSEDRPARAYRHWLSRGDVAVIAYNFDEETLRYVRYSMANKMPECLASGAVLLAHGPRDAATIDYLADKDFASVVTDQDDEAVKQQLLHLLQNPAERQAMSERARAFVFENHNLDQLGEKLRSLAADAAKGEPARFGRVESLSVVPASTAELPSAQVFALPKRTESSPAAGEILKLSANKPAQQLARALVISSTLDPELTAATLREQTGLQAKLDGAVKALKADDPLRETCQQVLSQMKAASAA